MLAALLASSGVGDTGDDSTDVADKTLVVLGVVFDRPFILELLLVRWRVGGDVRDVSMLNGAVCISCAGDSMADEGAVVEDGSRGVIGCEPIVWLAYSIPSDGKVWLLFSRPLKSGGGPDRICIFGSMANAPVLASGEKLNEVVGLTGAKEEAPLSLMSLANDVVDCEAFCR